MAQGPKLSISQVGEIIQNHSATGNAIRKIVEYVNRIPTIAATSTVVTQQAPVATSLTTVTPSDAIASYSYKALSGPVAYTALNDTVIDTISVTMPSSGGPWRALVRYQYFLNGGLGWSGCVNDGTSDFCNMQTQPINNNSALDCGEVSPNTYTNGQAVTFTARIFGDGSGTVVTSPSGEGSPAKLWNRGVSHISISVFASAN